MRRLCYFAVKFEQFALQPRQTLLPLRNRKTTPYYAPIVLTLCTISGDPGVAVVSRHFQDMHPYVFFRSNFLITRFIGMKRISLEKSDWQWSQTEGDKGYTPGTLPKSTLLNNNIQVLAQYWLTSNALTTRPTGPRGLTTNTKFVNNVKVFLRLKEQFNYFGLGLIV